MKYLLTLETTRKKKRKKTAAVSIQVGKLKEFTITNLICRQPALLFDKENNKKKYLQMWG